MTDLPMSAYGVRGRGWVVAPAGDAIRSSGGIAGEPPRWTTTCSLARSAVRFCRDHEVVTVRLAWWTCSYETVRLPVL
jgi:hypothetical protein